MITSKKELNEYLEADRIALGREHGYHLMWDEVWKFQRLLRKVEYLMNCRKDKGLFGKLTYKYWSIKFHKQSVRCGFEIPPNTFGPGLSIAHRGNIVVHPDSRIGKNCRLHIGVVIGTRPGPKDLVPMLGDNIYIGPGVKISGPITIASNIAIGANSVVMHDFDTPSVTIAGAPARKISDKGSEEYIIATRSKAE